MMLMQICVCTRTKLNTVYCCDLLQWRNPDVWQQNSIHHIRRPFICSRFERQMVWPHAIRWEDCMCVSERELRMRQRITYWLLLSKLSLNPSLIVQTVQKHFRVAEWMHDRSIKWHAFFFFLQLDTNLRLLSEAYGLMKLRFVAPGSRY